MYCFLLKNTRTTLMPISYICCLFFKHIKQKKENTGKSINKVFSLLYCAFLFFFLFVVNFILFHLKLYLHRLSGNVYMCLCVLFFIIIKTFLSHYIRDNKQNPNKDNNNVNKKKCKKC